MFMLITAVFGAAIIVLLFYGVCLTFRSQSRINQAQNHVLDELKNAQASATKIDQELCEHIAGSRDLLLAVNDWQSQRSQLLEGGKWNWTDRDLEGVFADRIKQRISEVRRETFFRLSKVTITVFAITFAIGLAIYVFTARSQPTPIPFDSTSNWHSQTKDDGSTNPPSSPAN